MPAGLFDGVRYEEHCARLTPGDVVLFASDGLHEVNHAEGEFYGATRPMQLRRGCGSYLQKKCWRGCSQT